MGRNIKKRISYKSNPAKGSVIKAVTEVRNSAIPPKLSSVAKKLARVITHDTIARRAFEIYASGDGGSETENWYRAERELRGI